MCILLKKKKIENDEKILCENILIPIKPLNVENVESKLQYKAYDSVISIFYCIL